uniref:Uncharacterized protein n=1 Tax=Romanomermis culicivorax TaxID=13658 RepID=A0A915IL17_ROMCU
MKTAAAHSTFRNSAVPHWPKQPVHCCPLDLVGQLAAAENLRGCGSRTNYERPQDLLMYR